MKRCYLNNFSTSLLSPLPENKTNFFCMLSEDATQKINAVLPASNSPENPQYFMRLTLQNADATEYELIDVFRFFNQLIILQCGAENTVITSWPEGTRVLCASTAGSFSQQRNNNTVIITEMEAISYQIQKIIIDASRGNSQILLLENNSNQQNKLPILITNMQDGDELLLEIKGVDSINALPVLMNACKL
ncbi:hypothetical protein BHC48_03770 [Snodgrassella communis]|uniref:Uncharacterized protein n=2 Tax=Snodgrassella TaxID=1193515 RepID=A0A2N9XS12_9NEIS|nr:hypothetical protein BHC48_03770 [Snodgrassella communis]